MNTTMTCDVTVLRPACDSRPSFLSALRRFFNALLMPNKKPAFDLPANMAARLYL